MENNNFTLILLIVTVAFVLWYMNETTEGYDNVATTKTDNVVDLVATKLENETTNKNTTVIKPNESSNVTVTPPDVFKDGNGAEDVDVPLPIVYESHAARVLNNNFDSTNLTNELGSLIKSGKILTSDQLLPDDNDGLKHQLFIS